VLDRLRVKGAITSARVATASSPKGRPDNEKDPVLAAFVAYMRVERRFAASTVETRWDIARHFRATLPDDLAEVVPGHVITFLLGEVERLKPSAAAKVGDGVRAFLRYLFATGALDRDLSSLALTVRAQRRSPLPKAVDPASVRAMLDSCDRTKAIGLRDLAVLTVMARLGLRAGEVAAISLDDIDWDAAELVVHGKGRRTERLPLPGDVGEVVATWLRDGRPACPSRALFVNLHGHYGGSMTSSELGRVPVRASRRAGLRERVGSHRLRHTAATEMLRAGASLREVAQVLRHASESTTVIYAKVDRNALARCTQPWPGAAR
jgi:integrase/recombinase XerD